MCQPLGWADRGSAVNKTTWFLPAWIAKHLANRQLKTIVLIIDHIYNYIFTKFAFKHQKLAI
jgi:hypothetical protein